jgi:serine/threonine protein kinase
MVHLIIEAELLPGGQKKTRAFARSPILVGRGEDADFRIDVDGLSAIHGRLAASKDGFEYVDLSSRNGSFLDGKRLPEDTTVNLVPDSKLILAHVVQLRVRSGPAVGLDDDPDPILRAHDGSVREPLIEGPTKHHPMQELIQTITAFEKAEANAAAAPLPGAVSVPMTRSPSPTRAVPPLQADRPAGRSNGSSARTAVMPDASPTSAPGETFAPGEVIAGKFRIENQLGKGGQGTVFKVINIQNGRPFAIKALSPALAPNPEARARFEGEAHAAAAIEHENVVSVLDCGTERDIPYILMEYLRGETLAQVLDRGTLDFPQAVDVMEGVLAGLWAAHAKGLVHRDVKPENIFIPRTPKGTLRPKLLDFGVAKFVHDQRAGLTTGGRIVGTCNYFSPEQAEGDKPLDARSDQYSSAVVLYRSLAGRLPHEGLSYYKVLNSIVDGKLTPIRHTLPNLPADFELVLARALQKDPGQRYRSVHEFGAALWDYASDEGRVEYAVFKRPPVDLTKLSSVEMPVLRSVPRSVPTARPNLSPMAVAGGTQKFPPDFSPPAAGTRKGSGRPVAAAPKREHERQVRHAAPRSTASDLWTRNRSLIVAGCAVFLIASVSTWGLVASKKSKASQARPAVGELQPTAAPPPPALLPPTARTEPPGAERPPATTESAPEGADLHAPHADRDSVATATTKKTAHAKVRHARPAVINTRSGETMTLPSAR